MKKRSEDAGRSRARRAIVLVVLILLGLAGWSGYRATAELKRICNEQRRLTDAGEQVVITTGRIIPAKLISNHFGLTNGANLANIPFAELRERLIKDMPNIRDVTITLHLPNRVEIESFERVPVARVMTGRSDTSSNRVADRDGVVFRYPRRETTLLPVIRESGTPTQPGEKLGGLAASALRLAQESADADFSVLRVQEADATATDYVLVVLGDASRAKVAWERMDEDCAASRESLHRQLDRLSKAVASRVAEGTKMWNATDFGTPGRIYASDPTKAE